MAILDIVIIAIIGLSAVIGMVRGLVREVLSLLSWFAAFIVGLMFADQVSAMLPASWGAASMRYVIAFAVLFVGTLIAASLLQWMIGHLISSTGLTSTDRFLGLLFGAARGFLVTIVILIGLREIVHETQWWNEAILPPELLPFEDDVRGMLGRARSVVEEQNF